LAGQLQLLQKAGAAGVEGPDVAAVLAGESGMLLQLAGEASDSGGIGVGVAQQGGVEVGEASKIPLIESVSECDGEVEWLDVGLQDPACEDSCGPQHCSGTGEAGSC